MRFLLLVLGRLWLRSLRVHWVSGHAPASGAIILLWHEHLPACIRVFSGRGIDVLISRSADGEFAARACAKAGYRVHRGSSSHGGADGMRALARGLETGSGLAGMALDGPRGPRRVPKPGTLWLARRSGLPVAPVWIEAPWSFRLGSWDRSLIPLPFSQVRVRMGPLFHPGNLAEIAEAMRRLDPGASVTARPEPAVPSATA